MMTFWKRLTARMRGVQSDDAEVDAGEAVTAAAALMVQLALADDEYAEAEKVQIRSALASAFALDDQAAQAVLSAAEPLARDAVDSHTFTKIVKTLPADQRAALIDGLWRTAFADGEDSRFEDAFIRRVADLIYVEQRTSRLGRSQAKAEAES